MSPSEDTCVLDETSLPVTLDARKGGRVADSRVSTLI